MVSKVIAHGRLVADSDNWLLVAEHVLVLDTSTLTDFDDSLENQLVSVVGLPTLASSAEAPARLVVERLVTESQIRNRANALFRTGQSGRAVDHWLRAERELLDA